MLRRRSLGLRFAFRASGLEAAFRLALWGLRARRRLSPNRKGGSADSQSSLTTESWRELAAILAGLRGAFAKAGQFLALRHDWLDASERAAFATLRDGVHPLPWADLRAQLERELGGPPEEVFAELDTTPIAAGAMAQVHRARTHGGEALLLKIQYPDIDASLPSDLWILRRLIVAIAKWRGRDAGLARRTFSEYADAIRRELDFRREAESAERIAENLRALPQVEVPRIYPEWSTRRVLAMSDRAVIPCRRDALETRGIAAAEVLDIVVEAYAKQIFVDGLFHADPHPANLFVLEGGGPRDTPTVLFVDFGLTQELTDSLASSLRRAFFALMQRQKEALVDAILELEVARPEAAPELRKAVDEVLGQVPEGQRALGISGRELLELGERLKALLRRVPSLTLPGELLLYAKTLAHLFELGRDLAPEEDVMARCAPYVLRFLGARPSKEV